MTWKFHEVEGREYVQYYVESDRGVRVEYCGCRSPMHFFEYVRGDLGFRFRVDASLPWVTKEEYLKIQKYLGPNCKVWVDDIDVARILSNGAARDFVLDITDVLFSGVLLSRLSYAERYGPPVEEIVFESPELERLNSSRGIADA